MLLPDANMLIYAFRKELPQHAVAREWLRASLKGHEEIGLCVPVELAFLRLMTKPLGPLAAAPWDKAWGFIGALTSASRVRRLHAGQEHAGIFAKLCEHGGRAGDAVTDLYIAALAIENQATLISADKDFNRIAGLKRKNPFHDKE